MLGKQQYHTEGPFRAEQLRCGDPYELDDGHPIECLPSGGRHANASLNGGLTMKTDPSVETAGFDPGFTPDEKNLRAPDIAVGNVPDTPGWVPGAPPLAVEYADTGQDEQNLQQKIHTLLGAGTRHVWVVRLTGPRRVEVYEPQAPRRLAYPGEQLQAPGILSNPVLVEALYDPDAAREAALRNLLQRRGYANLDAVQEESREAGRKEGREAGRKEGREAGRKEGREAGRKEGRKEGREAGQLALVLRQLQRVIGPIP
ncbi:MAG: Uma2 family endonuclease, partial [Candidatus Thiosymbion ectosymbiont of Robbea hypermnestra]|nr:Uma2 family endonuclease [Candidatus Thiosymbion ectosymbiont of Robbea hypermnestra]